MSNSAYRLQIQSGPETGREFALESGSITIGRYPLADIVVNEPDIAYRHALLTRSGDSYRIADLGSDAGTYVNGRRIGADAVVLVHGDIILLGSRMSVGYLSRPQSQDDPETGAELETNAGTGDDPAELSPEIIQSPAGEARSTGELRDTFTGPSEYDPPQDKEVPATEMFPAERSSTSLPANLQPADTHYPGPLPAMPPTQKNKTGRIVMIAAGCLLAFLACCCSTTLFMYYIGGDWLLNQLGYLP